MNRYVLRRTLAALLALALLVGCGPAAGEQKGDTPVPTGRYMEEQLALPDELTSVVKLEQGGDGSLYLFGSTGGEPALPGYPDVGPWGLWRSEDDGDSWVRQDLPWVEELDGSAVYLLTMAPDETFYALYYGPVTLEQWMETGEGETGEQSEAAQSEEEESPSGEEAEELGEWEGGVPELSLAKGEKGNLMPLAYELPADKYGDPFPIGLETTGNGDLLVIHFTQVMAVDSETGDVLEFDDFDALLYGGEAAEQKGILYLSDTEGIRRFDLETGKELDRLVSGPRSGLAAGVAYADTPHGHRVIAVSEAEQAVYYCDNTGLYRSLVDSPVTELLLGGEQSVLNMPSMVPRQLLTLGTDRYLMLGSNGEEGAVLYRYRFDPDMPIEPSVRLRIYSLRDNPTIRQAIGLFARDFPQVKVTFEIGLDEDSGMTTDDALRVLSTEIVSGNGPDVLVLDGLPVDSYIEKGVLLDLNDSLRDDLQSGAYLENIAKAYAADTKLYAMPARFTVPILLAPKSAERVDNLGDFVDWMEEQKSPRLKYTYPEALMQQFYSIETGGMLPKDGSFDEAGYREFLENIRRLGAYEGIGNESAGYRKVEFDGKYDVAMWAGGVYAAHVTELDSLFTAAVLGEALQQREGMFRLLGENRGGLYVPRTVLGVNAGGQTELAVEFVKTVLSEAVQSNNFEDGLPVNRGALRRNMENPNPTQPYAASFSTSWGDHEGSITLTWPEQRYFEDIVRQMEALEQPVTENAAIRELILGQSVRFFSGDSSLEDTAKELRQRIDLVLAE